MRAGLPLRVLIPGPPVGAARPRVVRLPSGRSHAYMPAQHKSWETQACMLIGQQWRSGTPHPGLVRVTLRIWHRRPQRLRRRADPRHALRAGRKPDIDNASKLALDAITRAGVVVDDARVCDLHASRWYLPIDEGGRDVGRECVELLVEAVDQVPADLGDLHELG